MSNADEPNPLREYFERNEGRLLDKWLHYFDVYHRHFARFRGRACTIVEIGIYHGGSLGMWKDYFGPQARIVGVDIDPRVREYAEPQVEIEIGDQGDRTFLRALREKVGRIDVLIDDGGHRMDQQRATFEELYTAVADDGVVLVEDCHTSYWQDFGGGYRNPQSFVEFMKGLVDQLNAWHSRDPHSFPPSVFTRTADSIHFYDSICVVEKRVREPPRRRTTGKPAR